MRRIPVLYLVVLMCLGGCSTTSVTTTDQAVQDAEGSYPGNDSLETAGSDGAAVVPEEVADRFLGETSEVDLDEVEQAQCHPSYDSCVPLDSSVICDDIDDRDISVSGYDEYGLDGDDDGVACETKGPIDQNGDGCHDSYFGGCVPVDRRDYQCDPDLFARGLNNLSVVGQDSFHLDADGDLVGCEPPIEDVAVEFDDSDGGDNCLANPAGDSC